MKACRKQGRFPRPALPGVNGPITLSDFQADRRLYRRRGRYPRLSWISPNYPDNLPCVPRPLPRRTRTDAHVGFLLDPTRPSPKFRRVGVRYFTYEACSGFTLVAARKVAQPPKAAFVTGLRYRRLPRGIACQLPDQTDYYLGGSFLHWLFAPSGRSEFLRLG